MPILAGARKISRQSRRDIATRRCADVVAAVVLPSLDVQRRTWPTVEAVDEVRCGTVQSRSVILQRSSVISCYGEPAVPVKILYMAAVTGIGHYPADQPIVYIDVVIIRDT